MHRRFQTGPSVGNEERSSRNCSPVLSQGRKMGTTTLAGCTRFFANSVSLGECVRNLRYPPAERLATRVASPLAELRFDFE